MIKAVNLVTGEVIVMPQYPWYDPSDLEGLRQLGTQNQLQCCTCGTSVFVKAGGIRLWHFAHKPGIECQTHQEPTDVLHARAMLYHLLVRTFGSAAVQMDVKVPTQPLIVDCVVSALSGRFAYHLIRSQLRPAERQPLKSSLLEVYPHTHWLFLSPLWAAPTSAGTLFYLNPTEREFATCVPYPLYASAAPPKTQMCAVHYLDARHHTLISKRGIPQGSQRMTLQGRDVTTPLGEVIVSLTDGSLRHPYH
jgi:hypothetical protein